MVFYKLFKKNLDKRIDTEKLHAQAKNKRSRMSVTTSPLFIQTKSAFNGLCKEYFKKNINKIKTCKEFLEISKPEMFQVLSNAVNNSPLKYNIILEATYIIPNTDIKENRAFKTHARCLYKADDINYSLES
jgi:hypothetical protein